MSAVMFNPSAVAGPRPNGSSLVVRPAELLAVLRADPRQAILEDSIRCLICGRVFRQLTNTHLRAHQTSPAEYKRRFGYNRGRSLMCRELQRFYAERAVKSGLAARIRRRPILAEPELRRRGGTRSIALEELLTRREARRRAATQNRNGTLPAAHAV
jgi:ROS/MUCR transcriptional regulator protein